MPLTEIEQLRAENELLQETLDNLVKWSEAYPTTIFPEPDYEKARELLKASGITLDAVSASVIRHALANIIRRQLQLPFARMDPEPRPA